MYKRDISGPFRITQVCPKGTDHSKRLNTWSFGELFLYTVYLQGKLSHLAYEKLTKSDFEDMSQTIRSRNPNQCRIFHGKMMHMFRSL
jgi:hypothetical protein